MTTSVNHRPTLRINRTTREGVEEQRGLFQQGRLIQLEYRCNTVSFEDLRYVCLWLLLAANGHVVHGKAHPLAFERAAIETPIALCKGMYLAAHTLEGQTVIHNAIACARSIPQRGPVV